MSTSTPAKRSLKPSTAAANTQQATQQNTQQATQQNTQQATQQNTQLAPSSEPPRSQPATTAPQDSFVSAAQPPSPTGARKRKSAIQRDPPDQMANPSTTADAAGKADPGPAVDAQVPVEPKAKKARTNTPWTPAEEQRLKQMRDAGHSWSEIAKEFPQRTEGSVKKHWYKDMHYAEFGEDESAALLAAIKEYDANKWRAVGQKVGKPAKACEQYAKEHFGGRV